MSQALDSEMTKSQLGYDSSDTTELLMIGGQSGSGKTSCALALHSLLSHGNVKHAVVEGDNLDLAYPAPWEFGLAEKNLAAMWTNYRALGYRKLIYTNAAAPLQVRELCDAIGDDIKAHIVVLFTSMPEIRRQLELRETGAEVDEHVQRSERAAVLLKDETPRDAYRIDTEGKSALQVANEVRRVICW